MGSPMGHRKAGVAIATADAALAAALQQAVSMRPVEIAIVDRLEALRALAPALLLAINDVDQPGAWDFVAAEERLGGVLFATPFLIAAARPPDWDEADARAPPPPWSGVLTTPPKVRDVLRALDREIAFEDYDARDKGPDAL